VSEKHVCTKSVSDSSGFHFWPCNRPAKYVVRYDDGRTSKYRCGIHARNLPVFATRCPVKP
jgi:hypothetical protein